MSSDYSNKLLSLGDVPAVEATYTAFPTRTAARWIIPASRVHRQSMMRMFHPRSLSGKALKSLIYWGLIRGDAAPAATKPLDELCRFLSEKLNLPNITVGMAIGTEGAYQKHTLRLMENDGTVIAYAKLSNRELSKQKLVAEHANLIQLSTIIELAQQIPRILLFEEFDGCTVLVTSAGPDEAGQNCFTSDHELFLHTLFLASQQEKPLSSSRAWKEICSTLSWLKSRASQQWLDRFDCAMIEIRREIGDSSLHLSMVHGDFAPCRKGTRASMRVTRSVSQWEMAGLARQRIHTSGWNCCGQARGVCSMNSQGR